MKVLLLGSGGREHALAEGLIKDPSVSALYVAPGNVGMPGTAVGGAGFNSTVPEEVLKLCQQYQIDLVVVGPEAPLVAGVADVLRENGIAVFGPSGAAAALEGSKAFAKQIMAEAAVPTAECVVCATEDEVAQALERFGAPYVVKDDGLAAGKGVVVTDDPAQALDHARACLAKPGGKVVIEEFLDGPEVSLFCLSDGETVVPLQPAQDFKRVGEGATGPNTGGMGAYSPLPWAPADLTEVVLKQVARPVVARMAQRGTPFVGLLYCGLALTSKGVRVIEFNVRFGDPETQVIIPRLKTALGELLYACATGKLADFPPLSWSDEAAVCVVLAAQNYPGTPRKGDPITGVEAANALAKTHVIHAGTKLSEDGSLLSNGGRVLCVVGQGPTVGQARLQAYQGMKLISLPGGHYRTDIAAGI